MLLEFGQIKKLSNEEVDIVNHENTKMLLAALTMFNDFSMNLIKTRTTYKSIQATIAIINLIKDNTEIKDVDGNTYNKEQAINYVKNYTNDIKKDETWDKIEATIRRKCYTLADSIEIREIAIKEWKEIYNWFNKNYGGID